MDFTQKEGDNRISNHLQPTDIRSEQNTNIISVSKPLTRVNGDNQQPLTFICMWVIIFIIIAVTFGLSQAVPQVLHINTNQHAFHSSGCHNPMGFNADLNIYCKRFTASTPTLGVVLSEVDKLDQQAYFLVEISVKEKSKTYSLRIRQTVSLELYSITKEELEENGETFFYFKYDELLYNDTFQFNFTALFKDFEESDDHDDDTDQIYDPKPAQHRRMLDDHDDEADGDEDDDDDSQKKQKIYSAWQKIGYYKDLGLKEAENYFFVMRFENAPFLKEIHNMRLLAITINPQFTIFTVVLRYVLLGISIISCAIFLRRYKQLESKDKILQIQLVAVLSVLTIFFNDPLYAATVLSPNGFTTFTSVFFIVTFEIYVFVLYLVLLVRMYYEKSNRTTELTSFKKGFPILSIFGVLFIVSMILFASVAFFYYNHAPFVSGSEDYQRFILGMAIVLLILFLGLILCIGILYIQVIIKWSRGQLIWREKQLVLIMPFFLAMFIFSFLSEAAQPYQYQRAILPLYGFSFGNLFVFVLQYFYYTPSKALEEAKKNDVMEAHSEFNSDLDYEPEQYNDQ